MIDVYKRQVFDRVNDSRFWKSFVTKYGANYTAGAPYWITTKKNKEDVYKRQILVGTRL